MGKPLLPFIRGDSYLANNRGYIPFVVGNGYTSDFAANGFPEESVTIGPASILSFLANKARPIDSLTVALEPIQSGTGDPSPDNERPISGNTEVNVWDDPAYGGTIYWNQICKAPDTTDWGKASNVDSWAVADGVMTVTVKAGASSNLFVRPKDAVATETHVYYLGVDVKCDNPIEAQLFKVVFYESAQLNQTVIEDSVSSVFARKEVVVTSNRNPTQIRFQVGAGGREDSYNYYIRNPQIIDLTAMFGAGNEPSTVDEFKALFPLDYYAYNAGTETTVGAVNGNPGWNATISLGTTVYGGTLDVISGVLTVTWAGYKISAFNWTYFDDGGYFRANPSARKQGITNVTCECYATSSKSSASAMENNRIKGAAQSKYVYIKDSRYTDKNAFVSAMGDYLFVFERETPQTVQLTGEQLQTLANENHVWTDSGEVTLTAKGITEITP